MTTRTDFHSLAELRKEYTPETRGIVTAEEAAKIKRTLELDERNDIELQNIRDMAVMLYGEWADFSERDKDELTMREMLDAMSAICAVIDDEKWKRGIEP